MAKLVAEPSLVAAAWMAKHRDRALDGKVYEVRRFQVAGFGFDFVGRYG